MSDSKPRPRSRRRLTDEERVLWKTVTHSVNPLRPAQDADGQTTHEVTVDAVIAPALATKPKPTVAKPASSPPAPPLAPLERRLTQRVARGNRAIDARLDLHGLTQDRAHGALLRFLAKAQTSGATMVLVITGKGTRGGETPAGAGRGILKRQVPQWLGLPEFRAYVVGFDDAHVSHGGEGALYVRIRRARAPRL